MPPSAQFISDAMKEIVLPIAKESGDALLKPSVAGGTSGTTAAYMHSCGVDYTRPAVIVPLVGAVLSIVWATLNIEEKLHNRKQRKLSS